MTLLDTPMVAPPTPARPRASLWLRWAWLALAVLALAGAAWMGRFKYIWHSGDASLVLDRWTHRICAVGIADHRWFVSCQPSRLP